jgi:Zn-dependent protease with chaperone function
MTALLLLALAVVLMWPLPRIIARQHAWRRSPRAALVVWQLVSLAGVLAALAAAPAAIPALTGEGSNAFLRTVVPGLALVVTVVMIARLVRAGHVVGRRLRTLRREHRELVDLIGAPDDSLGPGGRVLDHPTPTAYCLPGIRRRVVLSRGTLDQLEPDQLEAVLAHERAHLTRRHDLVLEFFTVLHTAAPARIRSSEALEEVRLLVEALADRSAVRRVGSLPLAHALVALASARSPEGGIASSGASTTVRLRLIDRPAPWWMPPVMYAFGAFVAVAPLALLALAWR